MSKACSTAYQDAMLHLVDDATSMVVCSGQPANHAGVAAVTLATVTMTAGAGNGDYTLANGDVSGRKLTTTQKTGVSISSSGTATHVVLDDGTNIYVTTCTSQALTSGGTVTIPAWKIEVSAPS